MRRSVPGMNDEAIQLILDPGLVEEAVLLAIRTNADQEEFRAARDALYALGEAESERAFTELHFAWFQRLGLDRPIRLALAELPIIAQSCARCVVSRSVSARDEGADLLVNPEAPGISGRTVLVKLRASAFGEPASMLAMLRSELLHVADMVDPDFGYEPTVKSADYGPAYGQLVRERYRVLWNVTVASRLVSRGVAGPDAKAETYRSFVAAFPMLAAAADEAFARFFGGGAVTHAEMMSFAASPRATLSGAALAPGLPCPLCRLPTFSPEPDPELLAAQLVESIVAEFPTWKPERGLCRQCADLFRARCAMEERRGEVPDSRA